jgi:hypothetical protein
MIARKDAKIAKAQRFLGVLVSYFATLRETKIKRLCHEKLNLD